MNSVKWVVIRLLGAFVQSALFWIGLWVGLVLGMLINASFSAQDGQKGPVSRGSVQVSLVILASPHTVETCTVEVPHKGKNVQEVVPCFDGEAMAFVSHGNESE